MKILIIGSGGREHALAWKIAQSPTVTALFVAPGNAGTAHEPKVINVPIAADNIAELAEFARKNAIDLTIVGPEAPLVAGIVDTFTQAHLRCFGPTQKAARLEGSKAFTKDFLTRHRIPTAQYQHFTAIAPAIAYIRQRGTPIVVKADGLAAGKGVILAQTEAEAISAAENLLNGKLFGKAGQQIVIEEFLSGEEVSFICMVDGEHILPLATSQDHKAIGNADTGVNTGGMGAYSPASVVTPAIYNRIITEIIEPTIHGMSVAGYSYTGFLYAGLMLDKQGNPKVLEYNCRLGDPETQPILLRLRSDLVELCLAACDKRLNRMTVEWDKRAAVGVVLAASGYPGDYVKGSVIQGLTTPLPPDSKIFHAGTVEQNGNVVTAGGRVLCTCALGNTVSEAQKKAYQTAQLIHWEGMYYRTDIGYRAIKREQ